jgi:hypothetical protein
MQICMYILYKDTQIHIHTHTYMHTHTHTYIHQNPQVLKFFIQYLHITYTHPPVYCKTLQITYYNLNAIKIVVLLYYLGNNDKKKKPASVQYRSIFFQVFSTCGW